jgi:ankyrin repeat protein
MLINRGMDVNIKDEDGETALHKGLSKIKLKY